MRQNREIKTTGNGVADDFGRSFYNLEPENLCYSKIEWKNMGNALTTFQTIPDIYVDLVKLRSKGFQKQLHLGLKFAFSFYLQMGSCKMTELS